ncbi:MAG: hypothetical protein M1831_005534 [Alyxoria varia]|nr:MAG: hypothetical protein M1831_005534 [Alyxoria varia]
MAESTEQGVSEPLFRTTKRRKVFRRLNSEPADDLRPTSPQGTPQSERQDTGTPEADQNPRNETSLSVSQALRMRKQAKARRLGVGFSNETSGPKQESIDPANDTGGGGDLVLHDDKPVTALDHATDRFVPQTGQVAASADQHMADFIDSAMARLRYAGTNPHAEQDMCSSGRNGTAEGSEGGTSSRAKPQQKQPASLGRIQEIDLGPDAALRNVEMTEETVQRLRNGEPLLQAEQPRKPRLGKDGKPRRYKKNRRNSDDIRRDEIVDAMFRENRLEVDLYDDPSSSRRKNRKTADNDNREASPSSSSESHPADDAIAEAFRRDFMESVAARQNFRRSNNPNAGKPPAPVTSGVGKHAPKPGAGKIGRGPKLGGSRSARAAMHAREKEAQVKK